MASGSDDEGMGTPLSTLSMEGMLMANPDLPDEQRHLEEEKARKEIAESIEEDEDYWCRLSSACLADEVDPAAIAKVPQEFTEYAVVWCKYGRSLDVIHDFKAHQDVRQKRFDRALKRKEHKQRAAARLAAAQQHRPAVARTPSTTGTPTAKPPPPDLYEPIGPLSLPFDASAALSILDAADVAFSKVEDLCLLNPPTFSETDRELMVGAYTHMMEKFREPRIKKRYGFNRSDLTGTPKLKVGDNVPSYFANVADGSTWRRKFLSMAGLRNLILYGNTIYSQLRELKFSGNPEEHKGDTGLNLMRRVTGNVVDLDTTVLRCNDTATMNAINASNKHKGIQIIHRNASEFSQSPQAQEIAIECSRPLLEDFAKKLKLSPQQIQQRRISPADIKVPVPVAGSNTDRGKHPLWHYQNAGQDSFHCNVPNMDDVNGALLKAPLHCVKHWLAIHAFSPPDSDALEKKIDRFFEDCVVDSCFNMKWKAIEEFGRQMAHEGTIVDILQKTQVEHQVAFMKLYEENEEGNDDGAAAGGQGDNDDDDDVTEQEVSLMMQFVVGKVGRDKTGRVRSIERADVVAWLANPSICI